MRRSNLDNIQDRLSLFLSLYSLPRLLSISLFITRTQTHNGSILIWILKKHTTDKRFMWRIYLVPKWTNEHLWSANILKFQEYNLIFRHLLQRWLEALSQEETSQADVISQLKQRLENKEVWLQKLASRGIYRISLQYYWLFRFFEGNGPQGKRYVYRRIAPAGRNAPIRKRTVARMHTSWNYAHIFPVFTYNYYFRTPGLRADTFYACIIHE